MGERRQGDRRAPEKGVIKIQLKTAVIVIIVAIIIITSISLNIILYLRYRELTDLYKIDLYDYTDEDDFYDDKYVLTNEDFDIDDENLTLENNTTTNILSNSTIE